jgi:hypothetical protein
MNARPSGVAPVAFHLRHIARSLDRLLTYAEGRELSEAQLAELKSELDEEAVAEEVLGEVREGLENSMERVKQFAPQSYEGVRTVGRKALPTTVGGLLIHCAEHTQRHVGQAITTAQIVAKS